MYIFKISVSKLKKKPKKFFGESHWFLTFNGLLINVFFNTCFQEMSPKVFFCEQQQTQMNMQFSFIRPMSQAWIISALKVSPLTARTMTEKTKRKLVQAICFSQESRYGRDIIGFFSLYIMIINTCKSQVAKN